MDLGSRRTSENVEHTSNIAEGLEQRSSQIEQVATLSRNVASETQAQGVKLEQIGVEILANAEAAASLSMQIEKLASGAVAMKQITEDYQEKAATYRV